MKIMLKTANSQYGDFSNPSGGKPAKKLKYKSKPSGNGGAASTSDAKSSTGSLVRDAAVKGLVGAAMVGGAMGIHAGIKHLTRPKEKHFKAMVDHAGDDYHTMEPHQKAQAKKFYHAIAKHSPTVAKDPIAAWNHTKHLIQHPSSYQPQTIEALQDVETSKPRLGLGK